MLYPFFREIKFYGSIYHDLERRSRKSGFFCDGTVIMSPLSRFRQKEVAFYLSLDIVQSIFLRILVSDSTRRRVQKFGLDT